MLSVEQMLCTSITLRQTPIVPHTQTDIYCPSQTPIAPHSQTDTYFPSHLDRHLLSPHSDTYGPSLRHLLSFTLRHLSSLTLGDL